MHRSLPLFSCCGSAAESPALCSFGSYKPSFTSVDTMGIAGEVCVVCTASQSQTWLPSK